MFKKVFGNIKEAIIRFPVAIAFCIISVILWEILVDNEIALVRNFTLVSILAIFLFTLISLLAENLKINKKRELLLNVAGLFLIILYYITTDGSFSEKAVSRVVLLSLSVIFFIPLTFLIYSHNETRVWNTLFIIVKNLIISTLFSLISYLGLIAAIAAVDVLFNLNINDEIYFRIWLFFAGLYAPVLFLSHIPKGEDLNNEVVIGKFLNILIKYIVFPLTLIYFVILYSYLIRVIFNRELPKGTISYLTVSFSMVGILCNFLISKFRKFHKVYNCYYRYTFVIILPLLIMLFIAILTRIGDYGITENRYFLLVAGFWLTIISVVNLFKSEKSYIFILLIFSALSFIISVGPWNFSNISTLSQVNRFNRILSGYITNEESSFHISSIANKITDGDIIELKSIVNYLDKKNDSNRLKRYFKDQNSLTASIIISELNLDREVVKDSKFNYGTSEFKVNYLNDGEVLIYLNIFKDNIVNGYTYNLDKNLRCSVNSSGITLLNKDKEVYSLDFKDIYYSFKNSKPIPNIIVNDFSGNYINSELSISRIEITMLVKGIILED